MKFKTVVIVTSDPSEEEIGRIIRSKSEYQFCPILNIESPDYWLNEDCLRLILIKICELNKSIVEPINNG